MGVLTAAADSDQMNPRSVAKRPAGVSVEIVLTAREARWRPGRRSGTGTLTLDGVAPRMAVMAAAPRREVAVMPASLLGANWSRLFKESNGTTNAVLSVTLRGRRALVPVRLDLVRRHRTGERFTFRVTPLKHTAHRVDRLGGRPLVLRDPTLLVDPTVTDAIKAMWNALLSFFAGQDFGVPPNPSSRTADGGIAYDNGGIYDGPSQDTVTTEDAYVALERQILDAAGPWSGEIADGGDLAFSGSSYSGLALFNGPDFGGVSFSPTGERIVVTNTALFEVTASSVTFENADVGGANLRSLTAGNLTMSNTVFQSVDVTGAVLGSGTSEQRNSISNSAFIDVRGDRIVNDSDGNPDRASRALEQTDVGVTVSATDFTSVTFEDVSFQKGLFRGSTFQGCGLQNMDFSGASFVGDAPSANGGSFQPTFDNSIMEGVKFDNATLTDVSFAGVDFTGGGVTFDGARLNNVDFTGATGLQFIDWSNVTIEGNVYGLEQYGHEIGDLQDPSYLRSITFDGEVPRIDPDTGYDIQPGTDFLIDTGTGARLERTASGPLVPVDPVTGEQLTDPATGDPLIFEPGGVFNPATGQEFSVDYATGQLEGP